MNTGFADLLFKIVLKNLKVFWPCVAGSHWKSVTAEFLEWISFDDTIFFQQREKGFPSFMLSHLTTLPSTKDPLKCVDLFLLKYPFLHLHS